MISRRVLHINKNGDWGWINFLSGIMVSSSINTVTGYCMSQSPSEFGILSSIFTLFSSGFLFALYQTLNAANRSLMDEIDSYDCKLSIRDLNIRKNQIWEQCIDARIKRIRFFIFAAIITGVLGLIVCLIFSYIDTNQSNGELLNQLWNCLWTSQPSK